MRLKYSSRKGKFNFCDPSEESISCSIRVYDGDKIMLSTSVKTEYEAEGSDVDEAIELIEDQIKKVLYSTSMDEWKKAISFLNTNKDEIEKGSKEHRIADIKANIEKLNKELQTLSAELAPITWG